MMNDLARDLRTLNNQHEALLKERDALMAQRDALGGKRDKLATALQNLLDLIDSGADVRQSPAARAQARAALQPATVEASLSPVNDAESSGSAQAGVTATVDLLASAASRAEERREGAVDLAIVRQALAMLRRQKRPGYKP